jgi:hypothetical protein
VWTVVGTYSPANVSDWLVPGRNLFQALQVLGIACFIYIVSRRMVPLFRAQSDPSFDRPLTRLGRVFKFWLGQWKHPRYRFAGTLYIIVLPDSFYWRPAALAY